MSQSVGSGGRLEPNRRNRLEKFRHVFSLTGVGHIAAQFLPAAMSYKLGERSVRLMAEKVLPVLHKDPAFQPKEESEQPRAQL